MDYSGLINLALVTIIYSSFIGPNLKRLGELKDEISNTNFPVIDPDDQEETDKEIQSRGTELDKKLTQYEDKHKEIKVFLYFFYAILVIIFGAQIFLLVQEGKYPISQILSLSCAALIIILVVITINFYMTAPWRLRSFGWLAAKGVSSVYTQELVNAKFFINAKTANSTTTHKGVTFSIRQSAKFVGYKYLLLVEGEDYERVYYLATGDVGKYMPLHPLAYADGHTAYEFHIGMAKFKPGKYSARLLIFHAPYGGKQNVSETLMNFEVVEDGPVKQDHRDINLEPSKSHYNLYANKPERKLKIEKITFQENFVNGKNVIKVLSLKRLIRLINRLPRPLTLVSLNGSIDRYDLEKSLTKKRVAAARIKRLFSRPKRKRIAYPLLKDK